jgi:hypothetical protein
MTVNILKGDREMHFGELSTYITSLCPQMSQVPLLYCLPTEETDESDVLNDRLTPGEVEMG